MTIYLLDDDELELGMWEYCIQRNAPEYFCQTFTSADKFKEAVELFPPKIAIIDFIIPFTDGTEICRWLRDNHPDVQTYVNTSLVGDEYEILAERCSATYLSKNMKFEERLEVVKNGCRS